MGIAKVICDVGYRYCASLGMVPIESISKKSHYRNRSNGFYFFTAGVR